MQTKIYPLLSELFDVPLIRAYQNGKEPQKPFATYALRWETLPEHFCYQVVNDGKATSHIESTLELQVFGERALRLLTQAIFRLKLQSTLEKWANADIAVVEIGKISDMPYLNEAQHYEQRAIVEIRLRYSVELDDNIPFIKQVEIENLDNHHITQIGVQNGEN